MNEGDSIIMEEKITGSGAPAGDMDGAPDAKIPEKAEPEKKVVPVENHKRALDDLHRYKNTAKELEARLNAVEEERLREKQDFKALAERYKAESEANSGKLREVNALIERSQKLAALERAALEAGIRPEAIDDLESLRLDTIQLETTSNGRFIVNGVKDFVEDIKSRKPHWFNKAKPPTVDSGGGGAKPTGDGKVTANDMIEMERKVRVGKATKEQYQALWKRYATQGK